ncbi:hypothetical protein B0H16DRAFT_1746157 [Mycena metata]|uniref:Uncharacterized protein n=1 Tax=Mycena metata TaxID=1033252 RepID=A0AAD7MB53_9AGAR|nr:hypothetical protein B0H16DRAFT_1746157 [Mycena metata]
MSVNRIPNYNPGPTYVVCGECSLLVRPVNSTEENGFAEGSSYTVCVHLANAGFDPSWVELPDSPRADNADLPDEKQANVNEDGDLTPDEEEYLSAELEVAAHEERRRLRGERPLIALEYDVNIRQLQKYRYYPNPIADEEMAASQSELLDEQIRMDPIYGPQFRAPAAISAEFEARREEDRVRITGRAKPDCPWGTTRRKRCGTTCPSDSLLRSSWRYRFKTNTAPDTATEDPATTDHGESAPTEPRLASGRIKLRPLNAPASPGPQDEIILQSVVLTSAGEGERVNVLVDRNNNVYTCTENLPEWHYLNPQFRPVHEAALELAERERAAEGLPTIQHQYHPRMFVARDRRGVPDREPRLLPGVVFHERLARLDPKFDDENGLPGFHVQFFAGRTEHSSTVRRPETVGLLDQPAQPQKLTAPITALLNINGTEVFALFDTGSTTNSMTPEFASATKALISQQLGQARNLRFLLIQCH